MTRSRLQVESLGVGSLISAGILLSIWQTVRPTVLAHAGFGLTSSGALWTTALAAALTITLGYLVIALRRTQATESANRHRFATALHVREQALEAISQGIFLIDPALDEKPIVYVNPAFERIVGRTKTTVLGQGWKEVLGHGANPATVAEIDASLRLRRSCSAEFIGTRSCGNAYCHALTLAPVRDGSGDVTHFAGVLTDVTDQKRLESQLRQAQKMEAIGRLAGGVAHDFNNLLTVILGHCEMIMARQRPDHPMAPSVQEIHDAGERAAQLTKQLLAFSRKQVLAPVVLNLNHLIKDLEKMLRRVIREDIELVLDLDPRLRNVKVDPGQMNQVLMNLLVNARDAMPRGGKITLQTANVELGELDSRQRPEMRPGSYVRLEVRDTGTGFDDSVKPHLFEPFFTTKEAGKGTGLGLATVYGIIKQSDGYIYAHGKAGRGAAFTMYFPCTSEKAKSSRKATVPTTPLASGEVILLVEDEDALRAVIGRVLENTGYRVLGARGGLDAIRVSKAHEGTIQLLLTDVVMPQMNGYDLARRLAAERPGIKTIFMSGYTDSTVIRNGVVNAGLIMLQKPFRTEDLVARVREVLDGSAPEFHVKPIEQPETEAVGRHDRAGVQREPLLQVG